MDMSRFKICIPVTLQFINTNAPRRSCFQILVSVENESGSCEKSPCTADGILRMTSTLHPFLNTSLLLRMPPTGIETLSLTRLSPKNGTPSALYLWKFIMFVTVLWLVKFPATFSPAVSWVQLKGTSMIGLFCPSLAPETGVDVLQAVWGIAEHVVETPNEDAFQSRLASSFAGPTMAYCTPSASVNTTVLCWPETPFFMSEIILALVAARLVALLYVACCAVMAHPQNFSSPSSPYLVLLRHHGASPRLNRRVELGDPSNKMT